MSANLNIAGSDRLTMLSIAIPTYNRADYLARLLAALRRELSGLEDRVGLVIADNASNDRTSEVIDAFVTSWPQGRVRVIRQSTNLGMDGNFRACAASIDGDFFWVMGDDDLPAHGAVPALLEFLERERPDLVCVASRWLRDIDAFAEEPLAVPLRYRRLTREAFGREVHVWATFLTGMIIRRTEFLEDNHARQRLAGTHLTQLSWVMERMREGERFFYVDTPCVLATAGNTGGYSVVKVFGEHFPRIVREYLSCTYSQRRLARQIVLRSMLHFMPGLLWSLREGRLGDFEAENVAQALRPQLGAHPVTSLILLPISRLPRPAARLLVYVATGLARALSLFDRIRQTPPL